MDRKENTVSNNIPIVVVMFTDLLLRKVLHNHVFLLLRACLWLALPSIGRCLQSHCLATGLYATIPYRDNEHIRNSRRIVGGVVFYAIVSKKSRQVVLQRIPFMYLAEKTIGPTELRFDEC
jgi:hypothetical protein